MTSTSTMHSVSKAIRKKLFPTLRIKEQKVLLKFMGGKTNKPKLTRKQIDFSDLTNKGFKYEMIMHSMKEKPAKKDSQNLLLSQSLWELEKLVRVSSSWGCWTRHLFTKLILAERTWRLWPIIITLFLCWKDLFDGALTMKEKTE